MIIKGLICFILVASLSGCLFREKIEKLSVLKEVAASQQEIGDYISQQEELFEKLVQAFKNKELKPGVSKEKFIEQYGEPVVVKESDEPEISAILLYRHPKRYFSSDRIYLYFNQQEKLVRWKYLPITDPVK